MNAKPKERPQQDDCAAGDEEITDRRRDRRERRPAQQQPRDQDDHAAGRHDEEDEAPQERTDERRVHAGERIAMKREDTPAALATSCETPRGMNTNAPGPARIVSPPTITSSSPTAT